MKPPTLAAGRYAPEMYAARPSLARPSPQPPPPPPPLPPPLPPPPPCAAPAPYTIGLRRRRRTDLGGWASDASPIGCGAHGAPAPAPVDAANSAGGFDQCTAAECARRGEATDYTYLKSVKAARRASRMAPARVKPYGFTVCARRTMRLQLYKVAGE